MDHPILARRVLINKKRTCQQVDKNTDVFLSNTNNLHTVEWFQVFLSNTNNYMVSSNSIYLIIAICLSDFHLFLYFRNKKTSFFL